MFEINFYYIISTTNGILCTHKQYHTSERKLCIQKKVYWIYVQAFYEFRLFFWNWHLDAFSSNKIFLVQIKFIVRIKLDYITCLALIFFIKVMKDLRQLIMQIICTAQNIWAKMHLYVLIPLCAWFIFIELNLGLNWIKMLYANLSIFNHKSRSQILQCKWT